MRRASADRARRRDAHAQPAARVAAQRAAGGRPRTRTAAALAAEAERGPGRLAHRKLWCTTSSSARRLSAPACGARLERVPPARDGPERRPERARLPPGRRRSSRAAGAAALARLPARAAVRLAGRGLRQLAAMDERYGRALNARDFAAPRRPGLRLPALHGRRHRAGRRGGHVEARRGHGSRERGGAGRLPPAAREERLRARLPAHGRWRTGRSTCTGGSASRRSGACTSSSSCRSAREP